LFVGKGDCQHNVALSDVSLITDKCAGFAGITKNNDIVSLFDVKSVYYTQRSYMSYYLFYMTSFHYIKRSNPMTNKRFIYP